MIIGLFLFDGLLPEGYPPARWTPGPAFCAEKKSNKVTFSPPRWHRRCCAPGPRADHSRRELCDGMIPLDNGSPDVNDGSRELCDGIVPLDNGIISSSNGIIPLSKTTAHYRETGRADGVLAGAPARGAWASPPTGRGSRARGRIAT